MDVFLPTTFNIFSERIYIMKTRLILFVIGMVVVLCAGCFLAKGKQVKFAPSSPPELPAAGNDAGSSQSDKQGSTNSFLGHTDNDAGKQQTDDAGNRSGDNHNRGGNDSYDASIKLLSAGDRVIIPDSSGSGGGCHFIFVGRDDDLQYQELVTIVSWSLVSAGIAFVAGMLVYRNNSKRLEKAIQETADEITHLTRKADVNSDGKLNTSDLKQLGDYVKTKIT